MKIKFDAKLPHQQQAIQSSVNVFNGQEKCESNFTVYRPDANQQTSLEINDLGYSNKLSLPDSKLVNNIQKIQLSNGLKVTDSSDISSSNLDFTINMETGTGKTYVYLRTILELYQNYGLSKHIVVVPSIAIKEGTEKSLRITEAHFKDIYDNIDYDYFVYNSKDMSNIRDFAINDKLSIMVINIDAFSKSFKNPKSYSSVNLIHRVNEKLGNIPLELIKLTKPIVYIDEPQTTVSSKNRKDAVKNLNPLAIYRYSATHREKTIELYKLTAVDSYKQKLVKQIEVGSFQTEGIYNQAYIKLMNIKISRGFPLADLELDFLENGSIKRKVKRNVRQNTDLEELTGRIEYEGYIVNTIHAIEGEEYIDFTSQEDIIQLGGSIGNTFDDEEKRILIRQTIYEHLQKEKLLNKQNIKVLSLFFIDTVSNYRHYDDEGKALKGKYAQMFEEEYKKLIIKPEFVDIFASNEVKDEDVEKIHGGYFSIDKRRKESNKKERFEAFTDTKGNTQRDVDTYNLIMKDKEKLLGFESKLRFIFSHSTLKEGWDNPNVFQICTLKDSGRSEIKRRQEIGRGLRLCVDQDGNRVYGHQSNRLTVMATESYKDFVDNFQKEIEEESDIEFGKLQKHSFNGIVMNLNDGEADYLGEERSKELYNHFKEVGYIDKLGKVTDLLKIHLKEESVELPDEYEKEEHLKNQIISQLNDIAGSLEIKDANDRKKVKLNRDIFLSEDFKQLWDRIKYKTTFSVDFDVDDLIKKCIQAIDSNISINRAIIEYTKADLDVNLGGVHEGDTRTTSYRLGAQVDFLPDIVSYLQKETSLTRKTIVSILTGLSKLDFFKINPQRFIEECVKNINFQMQLHIVDGIRYKKSQQGEYYSQELFKNEELFGYLESNLKKSSKSPYEYVVFDSGIESNIVEEFESALNIKVYAKLPSWFKIDTPLGTYNPDWAILWEEDDEEKLYFVVETKGKKSTLGLSPTENAKIKCGKKHFETINSELILASELSDIKDKI